MRADDLERLRVPYGRVGEGERERVFRRALGVDLPDVELLPQEIMADLDPVRRGIGWWDPNLDKFRRIFVGDQLLSCAASVPQNVVEARLHLLELLDCFARDTRVANIHVRLGVVRPPPAWFDELMPTTVDKLRDALLQEARDRGCTLKENINFWRVDGRHSSKRFNVGKTGTKVTLSGFCIAKPGVMPISEEDAHDLHIGGTRGIFDLTAPNAREIIQVLWKEILADKRD